MYTKSNIKEHLARLGAPKDKPVIVHTSLRMVGDVEGGCAGLLDALIEYFTEDGGLLCIPTHTWDNLGTDRITLDMTNPESNLGALTVSAARDRRGVRSENPSHSMMVFGDREGAIALIRDDAKVKTPTAPESAYGKIIDAGGAVLLLGVSQANNTMLHCIAQRLELPNRMGTTPIHTTVKRLDGKIIDRDIFIYETDYTNDISYRFTKYETAFRYHGAIKDGFVGDAPTQLCDAKKMLDTVRLIFERSHGADPLKDEAPIPPSYYSKG